jgi:hypothetical protein
MDFALNTQLNSTPTSAGTVPCVAEHIGFGTDSSKRRKRKKKDKKLQKEKKKPRQDTKKKTKHDWTREQTYYLIECYCDAVTL